MECVESFLVWNCVLDGFGECVHFEYDIHFRRLWSCVRVLVWNHHLFVFHKNHPMDQEKCTAAAQSQCHRRCFESSHYGTRDYGIEGFHDEHDSV